LIALTISFEYFAKHYVEEKSQSTANGSIRCRQLYVSSVSSQRLHQSIRFSNFDQEFCKRGNV